MMRAWLDDSLATGWASALFQNSVNRHRRVAFSSKPPDPRLGRYSAVAEKDWVFYRQLGRDRAVSDPFEMDLLGGIDELFFQALAFRDSGFLFCSYSSLFRAGAAVPPPAGNYRPWRLSAVRWCFLLRSPGRFPF